MKAVILAAGEGSRMRPLTYTRPKVMLPIANKSVLEHLLIEAKKAGIREFIFIVTHDDIKRVASRNNITLSVIEAEDTKDLGVVELSQGKVIHIYEKAGKPPSHMANVGLYLFTPDIFDTLPQTSKSPRGEYEITDSLQLMIDRGHQISYQEISYWLDLSYSWDLLPANEAQLDRIEAQNLGEVEENVVTRGAVSIGKDTVIRSNSYIIGPVVIGGNCDIGPNVCLLPASSIGSNVVISPFTEIRNSVIGSDVNIGPGCIIQDSVIDKGCVIKGKFTACSGEADVKVDDEYHSVTMGAMLGEGCNVGNSVVAQPGVIVSNYSRVQALKLISGRLPDRSLVL